MPRLDEIDPTLTWLLRRMIDEWGAAGVHGAVDAVVAERRAHERGIVYPADVDHVERQRHADVYAELHPPNNPPGFYDEGRLTIPAVEAYEREHGIGSAPDAFRRAELARARALVKGVIEFPDPDPGHQDRVPAVDPSSVPDDGTFASDMAWAEAVDAAALGTRGRAQQIIEAENIPVGEDPLPPSNVNPRTGHDIDCGCTDCHPAVVEGVGPMGNR